MLEDGLLSRVLAYLSIKRALLLKAAIEISNHKRQSQMEQWYEREFLAYVGRFRTHDPNIGGKHSFVCALVTQYYLSTMNLTDKQDEIFSRINYKLRFGR